MADAMEQQTLACPQCRRGSRWDVGLVNLLPGGHYISCPECGCTAPALAWAARGALIDLAESRQGETMGEEKTFAINDTYRAIGAMMDNLKAWNSPACNEETRAAILQKLKEAQFWALELVNEE